MRRPMKFGMGTQLFLMGLILCVLTACGGQPGRKQTPGPNAGPVMVPGPPIAQDWRTLDGRDVRLVDYRGKVVLVIYFTTWCAPCLQVMDDLHRLAVGESSNDSFQVIGVSLDLDPEAVLPSFTEALEMAFPIVVPERASLRGRTPFGKVPAVPTLFILDSKGRHVETLVGAIPTDYLRRRVQSMGASE